MLTWKPLTFDKGYPEHTELTLLRSASSLTRQYCWLDVGVLFLAIVCVLALGMRYKKRRADLKTVVPEISDVHWSAYKNEISLTLSLARQYIELGDTESASSLLNTVLRWGTVEERNEANEWINRVHKNVSMDATQACLLTR